MGIVEVICSALAPVFVIVVWKGGSLGMQS